MEVAWCDARGPVVSYGSSLDAKELVRQSIDIVDLVGSYVQLRRQGRNYVALCPWHDDSRPSLQVNPDRQSFKCWVCDIGGDVFSFIMKMEGVEFREALQMLAERAGIALQPQARQPEAEAGGPNDRRTLLKAMAWAERKYHACLLESPEAEPARRYLAERGITAESVEKFHLGFSPVERDWILRQVDRDPKRVMILENCGILARPAEGGSYYDRFKGRVLFSIRDAQGRPVGIGGRVLPELGITSPAKYVNSPETSLFSKSRLLYGLDVAREAIRKTRTALVMEGYTDVIVAHQYGFENAVAVLGTALGTSHIKILKRFADRIVLVLDGDEAGRKRTNEVLELFVAEQVDLRILTLPEELDPCEYLQKYGAEAMAALIESAQVDAIDHAFETFTRGIDVDRDVHAASEALERMVGLVAKAPRLKQDTTNASRLREAKILQRIAAHFRVDEAEVRRRLTALRRGAVQRPYSAGDAPADAPQAASEPLDTWRRELLEVLVAHPEHWATVRREIGDERLAVGPGGALCAAAFRLADAGDVPDFQRLMLELDDPAAKSLLVELDEKFREKGARAEGAALLADLIRTFQQKENQKRRPAQLVALREGQMDDVQTLALLESIFQQERNRQGISKPMDG